MKAYLVATGAMFGLIALAHLARISAEPHLVTSPWFLLLTVAAAALFLWAAYLLRRRPRHQP
jgi:hypothetical protein